MTRKPRHKYKIGDVVIWTHFDTRVEQRCTVRQHLEPDPDDDYDFARNGPLYDVQLKAGQHWEMQIAEVDMSPLPPPTLEVVGGKTAETTTEDEVVSPNDETDETRADVIPMMRKTVKEKSNALENSPPDGGQGET